MSDKPEWISVSERLPCSGGQVLFGHYYVYGWIWIASGEVNEGGWWCDFDDDHFRAAGHHSVTHWMPLPAPPIQESDDE